MRQVGFFWRAVWEVHEVCYLWGWLKNGLMFGRSGAEWRIWRASFLEWDSWCQQKNGWKFPYHRGAYLFRALEHGRCGDCRHNLCPVFRIIRLTDFLSLSVQRRIDSVFQSWFWRNRVSTYEDIQNRQTLDSAMSASYQNPIPQN